MRSMFWLTQQLKQTYPQWQFLAGEDFYWSPANQTIYYLADGHPAYLLHETAHAILGHNTYQRDIDLLGYERDAWKHASSTLSPHYHLPIPVELIDEALDTYRDWLHSRSKCPNCQATGIQIKATAYKCIACTSIWKMNEARTCGLRRYLIAN